MKVSALPGHQLRLYQFERCRNRKRTFLVNLIQPVVNRCAKSTSTFTRSIHSQLKPAILIIVRETEGGMIFCIVKSTNVKVRVQTSYPIFSIDHREKEGIQCTKIDIGTRRLKLSR